MAFRGLKEWDSSIQKCDHESLNRLLDKLNEEDSEEESLDSDEESDNEEERKVDITSSEDWKNSNEGTWEEQQETEAEDSEEQGSSKAEVNRVLAKPARRNNPKATRWYAETNHIFIFS
jgi:hypothetical protein